MTDSFMSDMQTTVTGQVESLTRYEMDASKGGAMWVSKPNTGKNENLLGRELMKIKMPFEMFEQQKAKVEAGEISFPVQMEILCDIQMGGQNRAVLSVVSCRPVLKEKTVSTTAPTATPKK